MGPWTTTQEHFAGGRLGFSIFAGMTWTADQRPHTVVLVSRILEKSSAYALCCVNKTIELALAALIEDHVSKYCQWSDGPKQFKNGQILAAPTKWLSQHKWKEARINFGGPSHWKRAMGLPLRQRVEVLELASPCRQT